MSKIIALKAENFKRLKAIEIRPGDGLYQIRGRNSQGKSSVLDAVQAALGGAKWSPEVPIRAGEDTAKVVAETDEFKIIRRWTSEGFTSLEVRSKDTNTPVRSPQGILDALIGAQQFDPLGFTRMKPREQARLLREVAGLDTDVLDRERETVYAQRTQTNRDLTTLKARLDVMETPIDLPRPEPEIDVSGFLLTLEQAAKTKAKNDLCRREVEVIKAQIAEAEKDAQAAYERWQECKSRCEVLRGRLKVGEEVVVGFTDPDMAVIKRQADEAKAHNLRVRAQQERIAENARKVDERAMAEQQLKSAERLSQDQTARLAEIDAEKAKLLAASKLPVPGLVIEQDRVLLNGVPFEQASSSQQIRTGFAIAAARAGKLRTVLCRDGSLLDEDARRDLAEWADENDVQILLEVVGDGPGGIIIEDGQVKEPQAVMA